MPFDAVAGGGLPGNVPRVLPRDVDMVIDKDLGPMILEMNARPGLNIQIANGEGLTRRIGRIEEIYDATASPEERARIARREFPAERQTSISF